MAVGDTISGMTASVAASATITFQPSAGVEVLITQVGTNQVGGSAPAIYPEISVGIYDGSNAFQVSFMNGSSSAMGLAYKLFVNNTNYLQITNNSSSSATLGYCGIQTK